MGAKSSVLRMGIPSTVALTSGLVIAFSLRRTPIATAAKSDVVEPPHNESPNHGGNSHQFWWHVYRPWTEPKDVPGTERSKVRKLGHILQGEYPTATFVWVADTWCELRFMERRGYFLMNFPPDAPSKDLPKLKCVLAVPGTSFGIEATPIPQPFDSDVSSRKLGWWGNLKTHSGFHSYTLEPLGPEIACSYCATTVCACRFSLSRSPPGTSSRTPRHTPLSQI